jgi:type I restriction enzyme, S subunit
MKSNYEPIGKYIHLIDERNAGLKIPTLIGLSISKEFIPSVANIIGSDMENYKIIRRNQFACSLMQVRRDKKMPVALLKDMDEAIISQAYPVFEVIDQNILLPEYLMMWFSRPEFDREACFYAVGGVRGGLEWEDLCNMKLPVPAIDKQKEIVEEYHAIVNRIKLNEQLNQKLEETAQAIYRQWFVEFEFPDENGNPYKPSGGEMEYNEDLEKDIPKGWVAKSIKSIAKNIVCGKTPSTYDESNFGIDMPFVTIPDMHNKVFVDSTQRSLSDRGANTQKNKTLPPYSICVSCIASPGLVVLAHDVCQTNQQINSIICKESFSCFYGYFAMREIGYKIKEWGIGASVGANLNKNSFSMISILVPPKGYTDKFHENVEGIFDLIKNYQKQLKLLLQLRDLIIAKVVLGR